jgi:hypothetical protein
MEKQSVMEFLVEMENEERYWEGQEVCRNLEIDDMVDQYRMEMEKQDEYQTEC